MTKPGKLAEIPNLIKGFNPNDHIMQLTGKSYLPVAARIAWLNAEFGHEFTVTSNLIGGVSSWEEPDPKKPGGSVMRTVREAVFKCRLTFPNGHFVEATGSETNTDFKDFIEKAETKALGRALGTAGYGTLFAPEFDESATIARANARDSANQENTYENTRAVDTAQDLKAVANKKAEREAAASIQEDQEEQPSTSDQTSAASEATSTPAVSTSTSPAPSEPQLNHAQLVAELRRMMAVVKDKKPFEDQVSKILKDANKAGGVTKASELPQAALEVLVASLTEVIRASQLPVDLAS